MNRRMRSQQISRSAAAMACLLCSTALVAQDDPPVMTVDGLQQIETDNVDALYWLPGATLDPYRRVAILDCFVAFRKDWERDQNLDRRGAARVTAEDMERIKSLLAAEFRTVFTRELEAAGYDVVDGGADDVLLLRPAIVDLDVAAPDIPTAGRSTQFVTSAGAMTLYMELYDSATNSLIGRVVDRRRAANSSMIRVADSVSNRVEADRLLTRWVNLLIGALDEEWGDRE